VVDPDHTHRGIVRDQAVLASAMGGQVHPQHHRACGLPLAALSPTEKAPNPIEVADPDSRSAVFQSDSMPGPGIADHRLAVSRPNFQLCPSASHTKPEAVRMSAVFGPIRPGDRFALTTRTTEGATSRKIRAARCSVSAKFVSARFPGAARGGGSFHPP
jgi:hypothetical protein